MKNSVRKLCLICLIFISASFSGISIVMASPSQSVGVSVTVAEGVCGNSIVEVTEECEPDNLRNFSCLKFGYLEGELKCNGRCMFDTTACYNKPIFKVEYFTKSIKPAILGSKIIAIRYY